MADAKKVQITNVIISLSEHETGRLKELLINHTEFDEEGWAKELYDLLDGMGIDDVERDYEMPEDEDDDIEDFDDDRCGCPACNDLCFGFGGNTDGAE